MAVKLRLLRALPGALPSLQHREIESLLRVPRLGVTGWCHRQPRGFWQGSFGIRVSNVDETIQNRFEAHLRRSSLQGKWVMATRVLARWMKHWPGIIRWPEKIDFRAFVYIRKKNKTERQIQLSKFRYTSHPSIFSTHCIMLEFVCP
jgi:hypothetical protein